MITSTRYPLAETEPVKRAIPASVEPTPADDEAVDVEPIVAAKAGKSVRTWPVGTPINDKQGTRSVVGTTVEDRGDG